MQDENPTQSGASIEERLVKMMSNDAPQEPEKQTRQESVEAEDANEPSEPESGEQEREEPQYSTSDLAQWFGVDESLFDVDEDGKAIIKTKIDGKEGKAKFSDVLKSYQLQGHAENKVREAAEKAKAVEARLQEVEQIAAQRIQALDTLSQMAHGELMREYQSIDWNYLRINNPGEYAALQTDFQNRQAGIQQAFNQVEMQKQRAIEQSMQSRQQMEHQEFQRLPEVIPEWSDKANFEREVPEIRDWMLKNGGYSQEEIGMVSKAHWVATMRKAMLYDKLQQTKTSVENKVRTAPKLVKPGQTNPSDHARQNANNLKAKVIKSGGKNGIADYLLATGKV